MGSYVETADRGPVRYVQFNRPEKLNALRKPELEQAKQAVADVGDDTAVIVFTGAGTRAFSVGMDVDTFLDIVNDPATTRTTIGAVKELLDTVRTSQLMTIAAVGGYCLGAAFELALACDLRVATSKSRFGLPEINLGLPCILDSAVLQQYVGLSRAKEIMLTGELYEAERMQAWGLLNEVVPSTELDDHVTSLAQGLATKPRAGVASQKRLFERWQNEDLQTSNEACLDEIESVFRDPSTKAVITDTADRFGTKTRQHAPTNPGSSGMANTR
jgi:enoyl-CoA hydratase/carnithine racemase